ncbi:MAG: nitrate reductase [Pseudomonadota bacterium]
MHGLYDFVVGPLAWLAGLTFVLGSIYRLVSMYRLSKTKDPFVIEYMNLKFGLRSILHWSTPFVPVNSRRHPAVTAVAFVFHACLLATPVFLSAHVLMLEYFHDLEYFTLPDHVADVMTVLVILGAVFYGIRRAVRPEVRYVSGMGDWVALVLAGLPFLTGFLAFHQIGDYQVMIILHILSGEAMLAAIPFTRLSHMIFAPFTRAYIGSEFGAVRHAKDW